MKSASKMSNLQLELLELYSESVSDEELKDIKHLLSMYYAQKAIAAADAVWEEKKLSNKTMEQWMKKKYEVCTITSISSSGEINPNYNPDTYKCYANQPSH